MGGIKALEEKLGPPRYIVATGTGALIGAQYAYRGIDEASQVVCHHFDRMRGLFQGSLVGVRLADANVGRRYRFFSQVYTLLKSSVSSESLGLYDPFKLNYFLEERFQFVGIKAQQVPLFVSHFEISLGREHIEPLNTRLDLRKTLSIIPFFEPVFEGGDVFVSTASFQGVPTKLDILHEVERHICLDCMSEEANFPSTTALEIMIFSDQIRTIELKRRLLGAFDLVVNLREWGKQPKRDADSFIEQGYQSTKKMLKKEAPQWLNP